jgi:flagellar hook protein FlgE
MLDSLASGVTGLDVQQKMLDVVGNNLANLNTTGYKSQTAEFSDLLYQTISGGTGPTGTNGGTNPIQVGTGVQLATITTNQNQGDLTQTGGQYDMAIQGNGYFMLKNASGSQVFTRDGSFGVDANGYLVDPSTGSRVQRYGTVGLGGGTAPAFQSAANTDIKIPVGATIPGAATQSVTLQGNLSASATGPEAQVETTSAPFMSGGADATSSTLLNSLSNNSVPYAAGDSLRLQGTTASGTSVNVTVPVGPTTTLGDLVSDINTNFPGSTAAISNGNIVVTSGTTGPSSLDLNVSDVSGNTGATTWSANGFETTTTGKNGDTASTGIQVFDPAGNQHTLNVTFQKQADGSWDATASIPPADGTVVSGTITGITFNANGSLQSSGNSDALTFQFAGMSSPQTINLAMGSPGGFTGLTQVGGTSSAAATSQDGYGAGSLTSVSIGQDGTVAGVFSNGQTIPIAQLAVANFSNPGGLTRVGNNDFSASLSSGQPLIGAANSGGNGAILQGSLEDSNVDVSLEFTRLIIAQRGFEANAKTISVSDQILQDLNTILQ